MNSTAPSTPNTQSEETDVKKILLTAFGKNGTKGQTTAIDIIADTIWNNLSPTFRTLVSKFFQGKVPRNIDGVKKIFTTFPHHYYSNIDSNFSAYLYKIAGQEKDLINFKKFLIKSFSSAIIIPNGKQPHVLQVINFEKQIKLIPYFHTKRRTHKVIDKMYPDELKAMFEQENKNVNKITSPFFSVEMFDFNHSLGMRIWLFK